MPYHFPGFPVQVGTLKVIDRFIDMESKELGMNKLIVDTSPTDDNDNNDGHFTHYSPKPNEQKVYDQQK